MDRQNFIVTPTALVNRNSITHVDVSRVEEGIVTVHYGSEVEEVTGIMAIEILMLLRPSILEGRRLKWPKRAWMVHNLIAHPVMQILALFRFYDEALWVHDVTVPWPRAAR